MGAEVMQNEQPLKYKRSKPFEYYYKYAVDYYKEHGSLNVPQKYSVDGVNLGLWVSYQRRHQDKCSSEHKEMLDKIGMIWETGKHRSWAYGYKFFKEYVKNHNPRVQQDVMYKGFALGKWCVLQRSRKTEGRMPDDQIAMLDELGFVWDPRGERLVSERVALFRDYYMEKGHLLPLISEMYKGKEIGMYVVRYRDLYRRVKLTSDQIKALESVGMQWNGRESYWMHNYELCKECLETEPKIMAATVYDGWRIGQWLTRQKIELNNGTLPENRKPLVEELLSSGSLTSKWEIGYNVAKKYYDEHGNLDVERAVYDNFELKKWLNTQRYKNSAGTLAEKYKIKLDELGMNWERRRKQ